MENEEQTQAAVPAEEQVAVQSVQAVSVQKKSAKEVFKNYFTATRIAYLAVFTALSFA